jgi:hypothetical protein
MVAQLEAWFVNCRWEVCAVGWWRESCELSVRAWAMALVAGTEDVVFGILSVGVGDFEVSGPATITGNSRRLAQICKLS